MRETADISEGPRRAVIDIGSNTVRLVVYGGNPRSPIVVWNEKVTAKLGEQVAKTGSLDLAAMDEALAALRRYRLLLDQLAVEETSVLATAAARDADNGRHFLDEVRAIGFEPNLLPGEEEARIAATGVVGAFPSGRGLVADLGGGSLELVPIDRGAVHEGVSLQLGTLRLAALEEEIGAGKLKAKLAKLVKKAGVDADRVDDLYLVGGTWRAFASYVLAQRGSAIDDPHGLALPASEAVKIAKKLARSRPDKIAAMQGVSSMRAAKLPNAAKLLQVLVEQYEPQALVVSAWGLREGWLYDRLQPLARAADPLLAGVTNYAAPRGGDPSLASRIAGWTASAQPDECRGDERLRLAATQLALATMTVEPNLRLPHALNVALLKRWVGVDFTGRAMLAAALGANCGADCPPELGEIADDRALAEATAWGLAMRLFRRLGGNARSTLVATRLTKKDGALVLTFAEDYAALCNAGVEKDLGKLADALKLRPEIAFRPMRELARLDD